MSEWKPILKTDIRKGVSNSCDKSSGCAWGTSWRPIPLGYCDVVIGNSEIIFVPQSLKEQRQYRALPALARSFISDFDLPRCSRKDTLERARIVRRWTPFEFEIEDLPKDRHE